MTVLVIGSQACSTWQVQSVEPREYIEAHHPTQVKLYRADGKVLKLKAPRVEGDSIVGQAGREAGSVALDEITEFSVWKKEPALSGLVGVFTVAAVVVAAGYVILIENWSMGS
jgi:hypothetical protein